jgi:hypothetical protein
VMSVARHSPASSASDLALRNPRTRSHSGTFTVATAPERAAVSARPVQRWDHHRGHQQRTRSTDRLVNRFRSWREDWP